MSIVPLSNTAGPRSAGQHGEQAWQGKARPGQARPVAMARDGEVVVVGAVVAVLSRALSSAPGPTPIS